MNIILEVFSNDLILFEILLQFLAANWLFEKNPFSSFW